MTETHSHKHLHPELHTLLRPFHQLTGNTLRSVWHYHEEGTLAKIILKFDNQSLAIEAEPFDDTLLFEVVNTDDCRVEEWSNANDSETWRMCIGKDFGWAWIAINQEDALDGLLLSFSGIMPQVFLTAVASSLRESKIVPSSLE